MRDIIITLPQKSNWLTYASEIASVARDNTGVMNFKLPSLPKESGKGAKCYLAYRGQIVGYMLIHDLVVRDAFTCATTGNYWPAGPYVQRNGPFYFFINPPAMKGFQGYHYYDVSHPQDHFEKSYSGHRLYRSSEKSAEIEAQKETLNRQAAGRSHRAGHRRGGKACD